MGRHEELAQIDLNAMLNDTPNCVAVFDEQDRLLFANAAFREALLCRRRGPAMVRDDARQLSQQAWPGHRVRRYRRLVEGS